jgi:hypothetical protein
VERMGECKGLVQEEQEQLLEQSSMYYCVLYRSFLQ